MVKLQSVGWRPLMLETHNVQIVDHRQFAELATRAGAAPRTAHAFTVARRPSRIRPAAYHPAPTKHLCAAASPFATVGDVGLTAGPRQFVDFRRRCALDGSDRTEPTRVCGPNSDRRMAWLRRSGTKYRGIGNQTWPLRSERICRLGARGRGRNCN